MKSQLHAIAMVLFAICFLYDIVVWGGVTSLPGVGPGIADSARREAPLATTYIAIGTPLDEALPSLGDYATARLTDAFAEGLDRIKDDPTAAMFIGAGMPREGGGEWTWACEKCSDPQCEHRLFTRMLKGGR